MANSYTPDASAGKKPAYQDNMGFYFATNRLKKLVTELSIKYPNYDQYRAVSGIFNALSELYYYQEAYNKDKVEDTIILKDIDFIGSTLDKIGREIASNNKGVSNNAHVKLKALKLPIIKLKRMIYAFMAREELELFMVEQKDPSKALTHGFS